MRRQWRRGRALLTASLISGYSTAFLADLSAAETYTFTVIAGTPSGGHADGHGGAARFGNPRGLAVDRGGNVYVSDRINYALRKITPEGITSTLAGSPGQPGSVDGRGAEARLHSPGGVAVDASGNVYVTDNNTIRKLTPDGMLTTLAGLAGERGNADGTGGTARFSFHPERESEIIIDAGIAADAAGNLYVADPYNHTIRKVTADGEVTTLAGTPGKSGWADGFGSAALFCWPERLAIDAAGNLVVADAGNYCLRRISPDGLVATLATRVARTQRPPGPIYVQDVAADRAGTLYVLSCNDRLYDVMEVGQILKIDAAGNIEPWAGSAQEKGGEDGNGSEARFAFPQGLALDGEGNLFVADTYNQTIRKVTATGAVSTIAGTAPGFADGRGAAARFSHPAGIAVNPSGGIFVLNGFTRVPAGTFAAAVRAIDADGNVTTLAGSPFLGYIDEFGAQARFAGAFTLALDPHGDILVSDGYNRAIRHVSMEGRVTTRTRLPGSSGPIASDRAGNLYFILNGTHAVQKLAPNGAITILAGAIASSGSSDGVGSAARFRLPGELAVDGAGNVIVADTYNHTIRRINPAGEVTTIAGTAGVSGDGETPARLTYPFRLAVDSVGTIFLIDRPGRVRWLKIADGRVTEFQTVPSNISPSHIAVDAAGALYVTSASNVVLKGVRAAAPE